MTISAVISPAAALAAIPTGAARLRGRPFAAVRHAPAGHRRCRHTRPTATTPSRCFDPSGTRLALLMAARTPSSPNRRVAASRKARSSVATSGCVRTSRAQASEEADKGPAATSDQAVTCPSCAVEIPCFNTPDKSNDPNVADELDHQFADQERGINEGDDVINNINRNLSEGRNLVRPPGEQYARGRARENAIRRRATEIQTGTMTTARLGETLHRHKFKRRQSAKQCLTCPILQRADLVKLGRILWMDWSTALSGNNGQLTPTTLDKALAPTP